MKIILILVTVFLFWALISLTTPMLSALSYLYGYPAIGFGDYGPLGTADAYEIIMFWFFIWLAMIPMPFIAYDLRKRRGW